MTHDPAAIVYLCAPLVSIAHAQRALSQRMRALSAQLAQGAGDETGVADLAEMRRQFAALEAEASGPFNTLLGYLLDTFQGEIVDDEFARAMRDPAPFVTDPAALAALSGNLVPVIVVHHLLRGHGLSCAFTKAPYWTEFTARYRDLFIGRQPRVSA